MEIESKDIMPNIQSYSHQDINVEHKDSIRQKGDSIKDICKHSRQTQIKKLLKQQDQGG